MRNAIEVTEDGRWSKSHVLLDDDGTAAEQQTRPMYYSEAQTNGQTLGLIKKIVYNAYICLDGIFLGDVVDSFANYCL